ncbi:MAG: TonB-dependent receptor [Novosphingobium sp.]|uniref:TonB-dependent receptor n=1 Tax=Novosphingobium sp. TaxID=1874826 RepID=UPI0027361B7A|nr:TonB-dependent receptor [Novosphingobium sp.]MDP3551122.1 TonB-dependent receptor [Novosphingobium sp.]
MTSTTRLLAALLGGAAMLPPHAAVAQDARITFDLAEQDLGSALMAVAAKAGWQIYAPTEAVAGFRVPALRGMMTVEQAVGTLLVGTGLSASFSNRTILIRPARNGLLQPAGETPIVVTGSLIRGADVAAPVIKLSRDLIVAAGQIDTGEAVRALPQNFSGGQNPGVGTGAGLINTNVNSAASANLRGLGPDATLTLLNGHRLPYDSAFGGVDISAIPVAALERIEVVPDGASALYGSDAVAGVVNVILRRDYSGLATSAQVGAASDGGYFRQQADAVAGTRWSGGGAMLAYDFAHNAQLAAGQRSYTRSLDPQASLYPAQTRHAGIASVHQALGERWAFNVDALLSRRTSTTIGGTAAARYVFAPRVSTFSVAPELSFDAGGAWTVKLLGAYGNDRTRYSTSFAPAGGTASVTSGCYCNDAASAEFIASGPMFALSGGSAQLAVGGGYRDNGMKFSRIVNGTTQQTFDVSRHSYFAFGEVYLPFVGPHSDIPGVKRLILTGALRYEDYPGMARLATPRLGLIYAPATDLTLKASWARSFKAPTLYQQYVGYQAYLLPAAAFGAGSVGQTVMYTSGGNPDLKPERARSWTAGFVLKPAGIPGLSLEGSYFNIRYRDRVVQPIAGSIAAAFTDPGYASLIDRDPSASLLADLVAAAQLGLQNFSGLPYNPANVVALVDNRNLNVAIQHIQGLDAALSWRRELGAERSISFNLAGAWLDSGQQVSEDLPQTSLSGTLFNPPEIRARASVSYRSQQFTGSAFLNYSGALSDRRFALPARIAPQATLDLALRYTALHASAEEPGLALSVVVNNALNKQPQAIRTTGPTDTPYDSTNYSPIGRFVAVGISRRW